MKVLLICESENSLNTYSDFFIKNGFETICYTWLLKALDNVTEINPDIVLIDSIGYPRHWKTFVQYFRSLSNKNSPVILITLNDQSEEEKKKTEALNVICVQEDFTLSAQGIEVLTLVGTTSVIPSKKVKPTEPSTPKNVDDIPFDLDMLNIEYEKPKAKVDTIPVNSNNYNEEKSQLANYLTWLICPLNDENEIVKGEIIAYQYPILHFVPDNKEATSKFSFGKKVTSCILSDEGIESTITIQVQGFEEGYIELCIVK